MGRDWPDFPGGLARALIGASAAGRAVLHNDLGTLRRMGPGAFQLALGARLAVLVIAAPALTRRGEALKIEQWAALAVLISIILFGLG